MARRPAGVVLGHVCRREPMAEPLQHAAQRIDLPGVGDRSSGNLPAREGDLPHQALARKLRQRRSDRAAAYFEFFGELRLEKPAARWKGSAQYVASNMIGRPAVEQALFGFQAGELGHRVGREYQIQIKLLGVNPRPRNDDC